uniref:Uncharacterized protein n=1 Tax=Paramormyrops kingsleyae TaxID=1676925 RepID=A0A3B3T117_9TELE
ISDSMEQDQFFSLLSHVQSGHMDDQRCRASMGPALQHRMSSGNDEDGQVQMLAGEKLNRLVSMVREKREEETRGNEDVGEEKEGTVGEDAEGGGREDERKKGGKRTDRGKEKGEKGNRKKGGKGWK